MLDVSLWNLARSEAGVLDVIPDGISNQPGVIKERTAKKFIRSDKKFIRPTNCESKYEL